MQKGFVQIPILIMILIGTAVVGGGYYVVKEVSKTNTTETEQEQTENVATNESATSTTSASSTETESVEVSEDENIEKIVETSTQTSVEPQSINSPVDDVSVNTSPTVAVEPPQANLPKQYLLDIETEEICHEIENFSMVESQVRLITRLCNQAKGEVFKSENDFEYLIDEIHKEWNAWETLQASLEVKNAVQELNDKIAERNSRLDAEENDTDSETYEKSDTYPIILSFSDNHGNLYKKSSNNGYEGPNETKDIVDLEIGDTIRATVEAEDPKGRKLEYNWHSNSQPFNNEIGIVDGLHYFSSKNTLDYTLTEADLQSVGDSFRLVYQVRVADTSFYRGGSGNPTDDTGFIDYQLNP